MELSRVLYAATEDAPPTSVDLDALIAGEHRRRYRQRWLVGAAAAAAVIVVAVGVPLIRGGAGAGAPGPHGQVPAGPPCPRASEPAPATSPTGEPTGGPSPAEGGEPTEDCAAAAARFDAALTAELARVLPGAKLRNATDPAKPTVRFERDRDGLYRAAVVVDDAATLTVEVDATREEPGKDPLCAPPDCTYQQRPDGTKVFTDDEHDQDVKMANAHVFRADRTHVAVFVRGAVGQQPSAGPLPLTVDELVTIGSDNGFTVFP